MLPAERIMALLAEYTGDLTAWVPAPAAQALPERLERYLALLLRWNARTNLTALREPEEIVRRHFGESLFAARVLQAHRPDGGALLDAGSGAGFPGLPIAMACPAWRVTLAESQGKKAAFLQEAVRTLAVDVEVWPARVEALPAGRQFEAASLRAVDKPAMALAAAHARLVEDGSLLELTTAASSLLHLSLLAREPLPGSARREVRLWGM